MPSPSPPPDQGPAHFGGPALRLCPIAGCQHLFSQTSTACCWPGETGTNLGPHVMQRQASVSLCGVSQGGPTGIPPATTGPTKRGGGLRGQEPVKGGGVRGQSQFSSRGTDGVGRGDGKGKHACRPPSGVPGQPQELLLPSGAECPATDSPPAPPLQATLPGLFMDTCWVCGPVSSTSGRSLQGEVPRGVSAPSSLGALQASNSL